MKWKSQLAPAEVVRLRELTEDVACEYYADSDWRWPAGKR